MTIELDIEEGDIILTGKFKNKRTKVNSIGTDEDGHPTINGKPILKFKIEKLLPQEDKSKKTREQQKEAKTMDRKRFKQLAGLSTEEEERPPEKTLKEFRLFGMTSPGKLGTDQFSEQADSEYKYNTPEDFLAHYSMGGTFQKGDVHPDVSDWAKQHNFDIPSMRADVQKRKLNEQEDGNDRLQRAEELLNGVLESASENARFAELEGQEVIDTDLLDDIKQFLGAF